MRQTKINGDIGTIPLLAIGGALWGVCAGLLCSVVFLILNPVFIDSIADFFIWLLLLPTAVGLLAGFLVGLLARLLPSSGEGLPAFPSLGLAMIIVAALVIPGALLGLALGLFGSPFLSLLLVSGVLFAAGLFCAWYVVYRSRDGAVRRRILLASRNIALVALLILAAFWPFSAFIRAPSRSLAGGGLELLIIGLDGASPVILDDMVSRDELPTFASIMDRGCYGELTSLTPLFSPMIWTSISTGKMPEKHGVRDFLNASYLDIKAKTIWEIFEEQGGKTGLYEWLCTWPPVKLNGFLVPGWLARNNLTYPASLQFIKKIKTSYRNGARETSRIELGHAVLMAVKHGVKLSTVTGLGKLYVFNALLKPSRPEIHYQKYLMALAMDADIFEYLLASERPKYAFYYHQTIDPISHVYWQYFEREGFEDVTDEEVRQFGQVIGNAYRAMDQSLGRLLGRLGPETRVMLVSDHGFQSLISGAQKSGVLVSIRADQLIKILGIDDLEGFHTGSNLFMTAQTEDEERANQILNQAVNSLGAFWVPDVDLPLFVPELIDNPGTRADYVRVSLNIDLREHFLAKRISETGTVVRYQGGECIMGNLVWRKFSSGVHHPEGIILALGPGIRRGIRLEKGASSVVDVTPTLLAMAGFPQARDMDGKVLYEIFDAGTMNPEAMEWVDSYGSGEEKKPIVGQTGQGADGSLRNQLKSLGYIDG